MNGVAYRKEKKNNGNKTEKPREKNWISHISDHTRPIFILISRNMQKAYSTPTDFMRFTHQSFKKKEEDEEKIHIE